MQEKTIDKKKILIISALVGAVILIIYFGLSIYFMGHFYFGSKIGHVDVSGKSAAMAEVAVQQALDEYELIVTERDGSTDSVAGDEIDLSVEWNTTPDSYIAKQNGFAWIIKLFVPERHEISGTVLYDEAKLTELVNDLACMEASKQIAPIDAKVSEYDAKEGYTLVPSVPGTAVNNEEFFAKAKHCVETLDTELNLVEDACYVQPAIGDDNEALLAAIDQLNKCLDATITYQVGNSTQVLDANTFQPWLYVDENFQVGVNDESLTAYVKGLASTYNTCYSSKQFTTSYGQDVVITNSHYGWKVNNDAEKAAIIADLMAGAPVTRDLNYAMVANSREGNDYGNSYVEINLTAQHLFVYVDGQVVLESDFVSGSVIEGWDSPTGIWGLTYKTKDAVLRGATYTTPVDYWMPFAGNVGMHDATWRKEFGGTIYKRDGSHGCINLPWSKAKQIYEHVKKGFPVVVYTLEGTESPKGIAQDQGYAMTEAIKGIGAVTLESEAAIIACRTQYDALSDMAKKYVTNYQVLLDAEAQLAALKQPVA